MKSVIIFGGMVCYDIMSFCETNGLKADKAVCAWMNTSMIVQRMWMLTVNRAKCKIVKSVVVNSSVASVEIVLKHCYLNILVGRCLTWSVEAPFSKIPT